jgi:hypothetical protein
MPLKTLGSIGPRAIGERVNPNKVYEILQRKIVCENLILKKFINIWLYGFSGFAYFLRALLKKKAISGDFCEENAFMTLNLK